MTVAELIEKLQTYDPTTRVVTCWPRENYQTPCDDATEIIEGVFNAWLVNGHRDTYPGAGAFFYGFVELPGQPAIVIR